MTKAQEAWERAAKYLLAAQTGLRLSELISLDRDAILAVVWWLA
jgi:hypothetical protein